MRYLPLTAFLYLASLSFCLSQNIIPKRINDSTFLTSDNVALYLKVSGHGEPCIFVHGGPGAWSKSFEMLGGNALEQQLTMYYYDQRGCGRSRSPANNDYSMERMIDDIENIRAITKSNKIYLVAHSFGGVLAFNYAKKYPEHVKGLILLNSTLYVNNSLLNQVAFINTLLKQNFPIKDSDSVLQNFLAAKKLLREKNMEYKMLSDNKATVEQLDSIDAETRNYSFAQKAFAMPGYFGDFTKATSGVNVPVLVISGTRDHNIGPDHYKLFKFPNQQIKIIEGGHVLYYENNAVFKKAIFDFVK
ncbi:alpha/beta hydrolase [Danxiaibacter flavus]|uniref:Alpha/beta hydrolase n=1 Tax=Danxiaibacter flavus TaxID=3049108 RepID=A0ABV3ZL40_9BACT|nr:alpha/beta hydrolase [Chitinophagaceae bacterium DXS]